MSTVRERLQATLVELQDELEELAELDGETRLRLLSTLRDIRQAIAAPSVSPAAAPSLSADQPAGSAGDSVHPAADGEDSLQSLAERLNDATRGLESTHPELSTTLGGVIHALAQMGI